MVIKNKLDKSDYYDIGLIILFSLYAYFFMGQVFSAYSDSAVGSETFGFSFLTYLVPLVIFARIIFRLRKSDLIPDSKFKITIESIMCQIVIIAFLVVFDGNYNNISINETIRVLPLSLNIAVSEFIYRAILYSIVLKVFGNGKFGNIFAVILSSIFFVLFLSPFHIQKILLIVAVALFFSYSFYNIKAQMIYIIIFDIWLIIKTVDNYSLISLIIIIILLYFALAIPIHFMQKRKPKENILTSQT